MPRTIVHRADGHASTVARTAILSAQSSRLEALLDEFLPSVEPSDRLVASFLERLALLP
jgi:hypothetical protein